MRSTNPQNRSGRFRAMAIIRCRDCPSGERMRTSRSMPSFARGRSVNEISPRSNRPSIMVRSVARLTPTTLRTVTPSTHAARDEDTRPMGKLVRRFEDLVAWQRAMDLACLVYEFSSTGPCSRDYGFSDQIHRSAISISSNIAEGFERNSRPDFRRFLAIAKASCGELRSQIHLALRLKYISKDAHEFAIAMAEELSLKIGRLRASLATRN